MHVPIPVSLVDWCASHTNLFASRSKSGTVHGLIWHVVAVSRAIFGRHAKKLTRMLEWTCLNLKTQNQGPENPGPQLDGHLQHAPHAMPNIASKGLWECHVANIVSNHGPSQRNFG